MYSWLKTHHKNISGVLNAAVGIAALVFVIMQNEDSTSSTGFTGMRLTGLIGVAMPQIGRLFEAKRVEDKAKKIADCFLFGMLGATFTSTAYSWGSALTTVELTSLGLTAIGNGFVEKAILCSLFCTFHSCCVINGYPFIFCSGIVTGGSCSSARFPSREEEKKGASG